MEAQSDANPSKAAMSLYKSSRLMVVGGSLAILAMLTIFNPFLWTFGLLQYDRSVVAAVEVERVHENNFRTVCPYYRDASTYRKWTAYSVRTLSWCEDYLDRL